MTDSERSAALGASRRTLVGGIVGLGVSTPLLAACGSDDSSSGNGGTDSGGDGGSSNGGTDSGGSGGSASGLAKTSEIPVGGGKIFEEEKVVVTQPVQGDFKAFSAVCTHQGCVVAKVSEEIECSCHGSKFSIEDGSPTNGPATKALESKTATVSGDSISVS